MSNQYNGNEEVDLKGIKGALVLLAIGVVISPIRCIINYFEIFKIFKEVNSLSIIFNSNIDMNIRVNNVILVLNIIVILFLSIALLWQAYLFFSHNSSFPKIFINILIFTLILNITNCFLLYWFNQDDYLVFKEALGSIFQTAFYSAIWIPYVLKSKRVKYTFTAR